MASRRKTGYSFNENLGFCFVILMLFKCSSHTLKKHRSTFYNCLLHAKENVRIKPH